MTSAQFVDIGNRLRALRRAYGDGSHGGQRAWARYHDFSPSRYANWENGLRRIPIDCAVTLRDRYKVTLDWIYLGIMSDLAYDRANMLRSALQQLPPYSDAPTP